MMKTIDKFDELLKISALELAKKADERVASLSLKAIMDADDIVPIDAERRNLLIGRLKAKLMELSFGQLLCEKIAIVNETEISIAEKTRIPEAVIAELLEDRIFTNNVPIKMMAKLLSLLQISYGQAEAAMLSTFERLKAAVSDDRFFAGAVATAPAYRKSGMLSQSSLPANAPSDGKELFENREVLEKYLKRLKELTE